MNEAGARDFDVLIVGGGIYGATAAYEAGRRGMSALVVERRDFGSGTSQNSMKIAHGGLRYLQSLDFVRSRESMEETCRLLQIAPHLVHPLKCRLDVGRLRPMVRLLFRAGLLMHEVIGMDRNRRLPPASRLPRSTYPCWYDALIADTERLLLSFLATATHLTGGRTIALNYTTVESTAGGAGGPSTFRLSSGGEVRAGVMIDCTGVSHPGEPAVLSMNLVVDRLHLTENGEAVAFPHPTDGRNVFVVPWRECSIVGTWNREYPHDPADGLRVEQRWVDELLAWLRPVHPALAALNRRSIRLLHAGLLPRDPSDPNRPARQHRIEEEPGGVLRVTGVKWTTARRVSSLAVQRAARRLGIDPKPDRREERLPALVDHAETLRRYFILSAERSTPVMVGRPEPTVGAVLYAVENERACTLSDVLFRRTGVAGTGHPGPELVHAVARILQETLGWSDAQRMNQIEAFDNDPAFFSAS